MSSRRLSYSEVTAAMTCQARWDFSYGGRLAGTTLRRRELLPILSDGRAWGAAVAALHANSSQPMPARFAAAAMTESYAQDRARMLESGVRIDLGDQVEQRNRLDAILDHYVQTSSLLPNLTRLEGEIDVPLPSRGGSPHPSSKYRFLALIDGYTIQLNGQQWIVEFKLRGQLQDVEQIELGRQPRWYGWALRESQGGNAPVGVLIDERLKEFPKPPRLAIKSSREGTFRPSHAKDQITTAEAYIAVCEDFGEEPHDDVVLHLDSRRWQQRTPILFREGELDEAGRELVSAAKLIRDLDNGELYPIRNATPANCRGCRFKKICANPEDELYVETLFERTVPKRLRKAEVPA